MEERSSVAQRDGHARLRYTRFGKQDRTKLGILTFAD